MRRSCILSNCARTEFEERSRRLLARAIGTRATVCETSEKMSWPFDISEPFVTPRHGTEFQRRRHGLTPEEWALPPTLVATFQRVAHRRMLERGGVDARNSSDRTIGEVDGVPCALARISIGAPAAALLLEDSVARGVRNILVVGSAGSLQRQLPIGSTVIVTGAESLRAAS